MLYRKRLAAFGPREVLLTSTEPAVAQFLTGRRQGPIGMSEEKDAAQAQRELAEIHGEMAGLPQLRPQLTPSPGQPRRKAVSRRMDRIMGMLHTLPSAAQDAIRDSLPDAHRRWYPGRGGHGETEVP
jgi:phospholipid/cholesterol/gamma-HCH transport system ATP-binding protein